MPDGHPAVGHVLVNELGYVRQARDTVVDEVHLSSTAHLEVDGVGNDLMAKRTQFGMDGITVGWRCAHDAHVAGSHQ